MMQEKVLLLLAAQGRVAMRPLFLPFPKFYIFINFILSYFILF